MFIFILNEIHGFVDATSVMSGLDKTFDLKFSLEVFSIMARLSRSSPFMINLEMFPPFFDEYYCYDLQYSWIDIDSLFPIMFDLEREGYPTLTFSYDDPHHALLTFEGPRRFRRRIAFPLYTSDNLKDTCEFDWSTFVSINSEDFITVVTSLYNFEYVLVTVTSSQIKFACSRTEIVLTPRRKQCIIGGLTPPDGITFIVTLNPMVVFCDMANRSKRVWLYKSQNTTKGVICAPIGLDARFVVYFPDRV